MKFDLMLDGDPATVEASGALTRDAGLDGIWSPEAKHDPFLLLNTATTLHPGVHVGTAVAVAFARTPMLLAQLGNDLQLASKGKFTLGLGTQVKPHIEHRYSMPWGKPAKRMREMLSAIHTIWDAWETGSPLEHDRDYYTHTLMPPAFNPGPNPYGRPPIYLGALGPTMTELAGQYADGLVLHRFVSETYIREITLPQVNAGLAKRERPLKHPFQLVYPPFIATNTPNKSIDTTIEDARSQIAFYASGPSFQPVLELHGFHDLGPQLQRHSREGRWEDMAALITDELVETLAVVSEPATVAQALRTRYTGIVDRLVLSADDAPLLL